MHTEVKPSPRTLVSGANADMRMVHAGTTENYQRYRSKLEDGTTITIYIPRANFLHVLANGAMNGRGQDLTNIQVYMSRHRPAPVAPNPIFIEPDPLMPSAKKPKTTRKPPRRGTTRGKN